MAKNIVEYRNQHGPFKSRQALMEVYRRHSQAFTSAEIDRARVVALQFASVLSRLFA